MKKGEEIPVPVELTLRKSSRCLDVTFVDGLTASLSAEYLRVHSPSAEVTGHSAGEGVLVTDKKFVGIERIEPIGRYAIRIVFDDGHDSGLYSWRVLRDLACSYESRWRRYLDRLEAAGHSRATGE
ncbi:MAG: DUF971 domain-containing protein [Gammaproteobacteria bacterium]